MEVVKGSNHNSKKLNRVPKKQHIHTLPQMSSTEKSIKGPVKGSVLCNKEESWGESNGKAVWEGH